MGLPHVDVIVTTLNALGLLIAVCIGVSQAMVAAANSRSYETIAFASADWRGAVLAFRNSSIDTPTYSVTRLTKNCI